MGLEFIINLMLPMLTGLLLKPKNAAKYSKWLLKMRDTLLALFPLESFPTVPLTQFEGKAVTTEQAVDAAEENGFTLINHS